MKRKYGNVEAHKIGQEYPTPIKAKIQRCVEFLEAKGLLKKNANTLIPSSLPTKSDIYAFFDVAERSARRIVEKTDENPTYQGGESSRRGYNQGLPEKRGAHSKISREELRKLEEIVDDGNIRHRALPCAELAAKAGLAGDKQVHWHTVRKVMQDQEYHKCIACTKQWLSENICQGRRIWCRYYVSWRYEWRHIRWSDEVHFGLGPERKLRIIRRPGGRLCFDCIQYCGEPPEEIDKQGKRLHAWAAVGWNFKTPFIWYTTANQNGKMSMKVYIEQILRPHVKEWIDRGDDFVLEDFKD